ncbi:spore germination protein [Bacillus sp. SD088]|uniref:spore germination protein n=1 Tax=Bacillus sp. SD088 TaxID=2782012 RepID=UPI001A959544|nr:spore germination protein [Bacillus sp. SD088]MBO0993187.1 spore germination protein [Bacillus sp. SD088]
MFNRKKFNKRNKERQIDKEVLKPLYSNLEKNAEVLNFLYKDCSDVVFRSFVIADHIKAQLVYIKGMSNIEEIDSNVLTPLMQQTDQKSINPRLLIEHRLSVAEIKKIESFDTCVEQLSVGNPILLLDGDQQGYALGLAKWEKRAIEEPSGEVVVRGPREGFTESVEVNTSLLRRKIKSPQLKMKSLKVGRYTQTTIMITYIQDLSDETLIEEITQRIKRIDIDGILESGYIEELIQDNSYSPFPQVLVTERPDTAVSNLLEGRVVIVVDGTPFVLIAPTTFYSLFQSGEDYYHHFIISTATRWLRFLFLFISLLLPSLYVAVITYHQEMVPTTLLLTMVDSREAIPFPALVEALLMEITFEGLREAGLRLPKQVGAAVSIVGALVIGQAAVAAGLVSDPMVMVVALTGIASFTIPRYNIAIPFRLLRFPIMLLAGTFGLLGIMMGLLAIIIHLSTLRSFGVPYLSPMAPLKRRDLKDTLIRAPLWKLNTRPHLTGEYNKYRQSSNQKPFPNKNEEE